MLCNSNAFALLTVLATGTTFVNAHGHVAKWTVGGVEKAGFNPSYAAAYGPTAERPTDNSDQGFADYTTGIVACGGLSAGSGLETWDVNAGDSVTAHWNTWPDSHKGPVTEYMAACPAAGCDGVDAASLQWFKIDEATFDGSKWPSDTIVSTLDWTFKIPSDLKAGPYLVRHDIIAMHSTGAPQVYPVCFQANLISTGSAVPTDTVTFPEAYDLNDDFKTWSLYGGDQSAFVPPGPAVYGGGSGSAPAPSSAVPSSAAPSSAAPSGTGLPPTEIPSVSTSAATPIETSPVDEYPEVPSTTTSAAEPAETTPVDQYPVEPEYPETSAVPSASASASATGAAPSAAPSSTAPTTPTTPGNAEMGGAVPPVTQNGNRYEALGVSYNSESDAVYAVCMEQMNRCKNWANSLPNAEVSAAFSSCDAQETSCVSSGGSVKRAIVMNRYAKRALY